ncbi:MAG TPA: metallopeptidase family protein [Geminicoccaceae bacterium]|nr:metallopeptidase family protein [Geminicoccaceae bacterium]
MRRRRPASDSPHGLPPSADDLARLGQEVLDELPPEFRDHVRSVPIRIEDFADDETLEEMEIEDPFDLSGLYRGVPIGLQEGVSVPSGVPDMIHLYRRPILDEWCERGIPLKELVRTVLIHEIGHHLGLSDEDIDRIEEEARLEEGE